MSEPVHDGTLVQKQQSAVRTTLSPREQAIELRSAGFTYQQIANQLNVTLSTAHGYVKREIAKQRQELAESRADVRDLDLNKLAWLERRLMQATNDGDWKAGRLLIASIQLRRLYMKDLPPKDTLSDIAAETAAFSFWPKSDSTDESSDAE
jgi:hypothetical protein